MSEERKFKQRRAKVAKRANVTSDIQPMALEPAWNYFIKIGEGGIGYVMINRTLGVNLLDGLKRNITSIRRCL